MKILSIYFCVLINFLFINAFFSQNIITNDPQIVFNKILHDYGKIDSLSNGYCEFIFKNEGLSDLFIYDAKGSCGCTSPEWTKDAVKPGETGVIKVLYDTKKVGYINKSITVLTNATNYPDGVIPLRIKGEVIRKN
jgi:hypothetical protein